QLFADKNFVSYLFNFPTGDGIESWSAQSFTRSQVKTRVVPRATNCIADYQAVSERTVIMSAEGTHGKELLSAAREENIFSIKLTCDHATIGEFFDWKSVFEIGFGRVGHIP